MELKASGNVWNTCIRSIYSFEIYSEKGKGTTILISVPYQKDLSLLREAEEDEGEIHEE